jgi:para-aminobenzoate synthetase
MSATLLIDNHDSFTYNLAALLEEATGFRPLIVRNDATDWRALATQHFDRIVISPGPGRPQRAADLGLSADAILQGEIPVLGVCLGHQAIAHLHGAEVGLAAAPLHGRLTQVYHGGRDLLSGLPSPFTAVRYHSLAVLHLSDDLVALAQADDGTLMALRHRSRPLWGVQFHPESICAEHGAQLIRRFIELSPPRLQARSGTPRRAASPKTLQPPRWRVHAQPLDAYVAPEHAFQLLFAAREHAFWLDSSCVPQAANAVSYIGDASGPHAEIVSYALADNEIVSTQRSGEQRLAGDVLGYLQSRLDARRADTSAVPFDFAAGYVGYFGYELKNLLIEGGRERARTPDAAWLFADRVIAFDHREQRTWLLCFDAAEGLSAENASWMRSTAELLANAHTEGSEAIPPQQGQVSDCHWRHDASSYRERIEQSLEAIRQGESYEICLTNQLIARCSLSPLHTYLALRRVNPAPYAALLRFGPLSVLCASPELFLHVTADGCVASKPIKGTAARNPDPVLDAQAATELASSVKSRAENLMIVDLVRNDLNRVCVAGSVQVPQLFAVESYPFVHQLVSTVIGTLRPQATAIDVVRATFPGGSMTGAPKQRTLQILEQLEQGPRGIYAGSLGYLGVSGAAKLNIVIRTLVVDGAELTIGTGGAIVALSDPATEIAETLLKMAGLTEGLVQAGVLPGTRAAEFGQSVMRTPT